VVARLALRDRGGDRRVPAGSATASLDGDITFGAGLDLKASIGFFSGVKVDFESQVSAALLAHLHANGAYTFLSKDYEVEVPLGGQYKYFIFYIGGVPVVVKPMLELGIVVEGSVNVSLNATVSRSETINSGFSLRNGNIDPFVNSSGTPTTFTADPPSGGMQFRIEPRAVLGAEFYGGFELGVGYAGGLEALLDSAACGVQMNFYFDALAKFEVEFFGKGPRRPGVPQQAVEGPGVELDLPRLHPAGRVVHRHGGDADRPGLVVGRTRGHRPVGHRVGRGPGRLVHAPFDAIGLNAGAERQRRLRDRPQWSGRRRIDRDRRWPTYDTSDLTIQFVPTSSTVEFTYVFGSDEYIEFVDSAYNDVFGAFVNGANCAVVDKGYELVPTTVNAVNHLRNTLQYRDNESASLNVQADGLTTVLRCRAAVNPGVTNTLRLAIADTGDGILDSWAFIQRGSLRSG